MPDLRPTERFSSRVENYVRYRPSYPPGILLTLRDGCGLSAGSIVADIGSGTGILSSIFLQNGNTVFGVEPNREMRAAGERLLQDQPRFHSIIGTAEATTLPDNSVDFVVAGQAFHWFEADKAKVEFARILKPEGWVALVWNERRASETPFHQAYEKLLLSYAPFEEHIQQKTTLFETLAEWFAPHPMQHRIFPNAQEFDWEGLRGRLLSSSYMPEVGHPNHEPMIVDLEAIFRAHQTNGHIRFEYETSVYFGQCS
jgi:ubiquinone/menaquinone biosynthesis C-methylase UbiE